MQMNRSTERELFLRYLVDIYQQNPDLPLSYKTIYIELLRFITYDGKQDRIPLDSLVGVQVKLNNKFGSDSGINKYMSSNGDFLVVENRLGKNDDAYLAAIKNGIKLYISVEADNLYKVSELLFNFMVNNGITMQCKVSKEMRNDALICRVTNSDDALKVSEYLNSLNYKSNIRPNPFLFDNGKVCIAIDGVLSFNVILSRLLKEYLLVKRNTHTIEKIALNKDFNISEDFNNFIRSQIKFLNSSQKKDFMDLYEIDNETKYKDFIRVSELISKNLDNNLIIEELFSYQDIKNIDFDSHNELVFEQDEDKIKYIMNILACYYSIDHVHKLIMQFIKTGNYDLFTRDYGGLRNIIRNILENNFTKEDIKNIISNLGWRALISASKVTYDKYGEKQLLGAIENLFDGNEMNIFTNDYEVRSYLTFIIPPELLKSVIIDKLNENGKSISSVSLYELIFYEISSKLEKEKNGRK